MSDHKMPDNKFVFMYNYEMMRRVLEIISTAKDGSTLEGCKILAEMTLKELKE